QNGHDGSRLFTLSGGAACPRSTSGRARRPGENTTQSPVVTSKRSSGSAMILAYRRNTFESGAVAEPRRTRVPWGMRARYAGLWLFAAQFAVSAWCRDPETPRAVCGALLSSAFWTLLAVLCRGKAARAVLALSASSLIVIELYYFRLYHSTIDEN